MKHLLLTAIIILVLANLISAQSSGPLAITHPGESWHLHIFFDTEEETGHLDALSVKQGTLLKLPVRRI